MRPAPTQVEEVAAQDQEESWDVASLEGWRPCRVDVNLDYWNL